MIAARYAYMMHAQGEPKVIIGLLEQLRCVYKYKAASKAKVKASGVLSSAPPRLPR